MTVKKRILMIDGDSQAVAEMKDGFLASGDDIDLHHVYSAEEAMHYLRSEGEYQGVMRPHLVITELDLPGGNAIDLITRVKSDNMLMAVPIVVYTATKTTSLISGAYKLKIACCIPKPQDSESIKGIAKDLRHFFLKESPAPAGNPLLEALLNPGAKKAKVKLNDEVVAIKDVAEKTGAERREFTRVAAPLTVKTRIFSAVEVGRLIQALTKPSPNLERLVVIDDKDDPVRLTCLDVSTGGMGAEGYPDLLGAHSFDRGTHLAMIVEIPKLDHPIRAVGQVMWSKEVKKNLYRAGLMFLAIDPADRQILEGMIEEIAAG